MAFNSKYTMLAALLLTLSPLAGASDLYLYEDEYGHKVWGSSVPAHLVGRGYSVHTTNGALVREVARALSSEEEAEQAEELAMQNQKENMRMRQLQFDNLLLRRYSSLNDYEDRSSLALRALFDRKQQIDVRLSETGQNIEGLDQEIQQAKQSNNRPSAVQVSQLANLNVVRSRIMKEISRVEDEIMQYQTQSELEFHRLSQLLADK